MATWHTYVGGFTKEFQNQIDYIETSRQALKSLTSPPEGRKDLRQVDEVAEYSTGIDHFTFDDETGAFEYIDTTEGLANPQNMALHPTLPVLYTIEWLRQGSLVALASGPDGHLERLSSTTTGGELSDAVCVHPNGRIAYVAHWGDGTISACALDERGAVVSVTTVVQGLSRGYFQREHLHDIRMNSDATMLLVTDVGGDEVIGYNAAPDGSIDAEPSIRIPFPQDSHPRNLVFHPSEQYAYVGGQWDSMLHVLAADGGRPSRRIASYTTMPPEFTGENAKIAQLEVHPNGRFVYVLNRNSNTIAIFAVLESGSLEPVGHHKTTGRGPSSIAIHPSGRFALVGNVFSGSIEIFRIQDDGTLVATVDAVPARAPRSFVFIPA